jgi:hypothetical protein
VSSGAVPIFSKLDTAPVSGWSGVLLDSEFGRAPEAAAPGGLITELGRHTASAIAFYWLDTRRIRSVALRP